MYLQKWRTTVSNSLAGFRLQLRGRLLWSPHAPHLHATRTGGIPQAEPVGVRAQVKSALRAESRTWGVLLICKSKWLLSFL